MNTLTCTFYYVLFYVPQEREYNFGAGGFVTMFIAKQYYG